MRPRGDPAALSVFGVHDAVAGETIPADLRRLYPLAGHGLDRGSPQLRDVHGPRDVLASFGGGAQARDSGDIVWTR
jgi:hypothetical protein